MKKVSTRFLSFALTLTLNIPPGFSALADASASVPGTAASRSAAMAQSPVESALAVLPSSDMLAVVDAERLIRDVLPKIKMLMPDGGADMMKEVEEFKNKTGIDIWQLKSITIGANLSGTTPSAFAAVFDGVEVNAKLLPAIVAADKNSEFEKMDYKNQTIYVIKTKKENKGKSGDSSDPTAVVREAVGSAIDEDMALVQLDTTRVVVGTKDGVKKVVDVKEGAPRAAGSEMSAVLSLAKSNAVIRYATIFPESARQMAAGQDLVKELAAIKLVAGSLDVGDDLSLFIDSVMRAGTTAEAGKVETTVNQLLGLVRLFTSSSQEPWVGPVNNLLSQVKVSTKDTDVSVGMTVPRSLMDEISKLAKEAQSKVAATPAAADNTPPPAKKTATARRPATRKATVTRKKVR
jgi:hypothetical protein